VPAGKDVVVMFRLGALMVIARPFETLACGEALSLTWMVNEEVPAVVGVPLIVPFAGSKDKPEGREPPLADHV